MTTRTRARLAAPYFGARREPSKLSDRTALGNHRILADEHGHVTFRYQDSEDRQWHTLTLPALEFLRRFLQHVLPPGFQRVRYYGWLSAAATAKWERLLALLDWRAPAPAPPAPPAPLLCPHCGAPLQLVGKLARAPP